MSLRDRLVDERLDQAWKTFDAADTSPNRESKVKCVVDLIVERESALAKKQGKDPKKDSSILHDELAGFLNAGFETTSSAVSWGLKYLTEHQHVQRKLRESLTQAFRKARKAGHQPAAKEIAEAHLPYLDAFIDEALRYSAIIAANIRVTTTDVQVLGHIIPKGMSLSFDAEDPS